MKATSVITSPPGRVTRMSSRAAWNGSSMCSNTAWVHVAAKVSSAKGIAWMSANPSASSNFRYSRLRWPGRQLRRSPPPNSKTGWPAGMVANQRSR